MNALANYARLLDEAGKTGRAIPQLSLTQALSVEDAYEVQRLGVALRLARGEKRVGMKMGQTSRAKMEQMGVKEPIWGRLTDAMQLELGGTLLLKGLLHPRAEPEIAFLMKHPLSGTVTAKEALAAVEAIAPAIEIVDSRYEDFKFSLADTLADDCSACRFVVGPWVSAATDIADRPIQIRFSGELVASGSTRDILDHPLNSLAEAARLSSLAGEPLQPGWIVLAGAATAATALKGGLEVVATVEGLAPARFRTTA